ncbi:MAG TPA: MarR family transcriptional regulator [Acidimicrobiia bacterium]
MTTPTPRWLDHEEMSAWRGLVETFADVEADLDADLQRAHGMTSGDYGVLVHLSEEESGRLRMCDLAERLHLSPSGLTRRIDSLVRNGLVRREQAPEDRRVIWAVLTPEGRRRIEVAAPDHVESVRRCFFDHLSRTQVRELGRALAALRSGRAATAAPGSRRAGIDAGHAGHAAR